jgi:hypothetical protein
VLPGAPAGGVVRLLPHIDNSVNPGLTHLVQAPAVLLTPHVESFYNAAEFGWGMAVQAPSDLVAQPEPGYPQAVFHEAAVENIEELGRRKGLQTLMPVKDLGIQNELLL